MWIGRLATVFSCVFRIGRAAAVAERQQAPAAPQLLGDGEPDVRDALAIALIDERPQPFDVGGFSSR